MWKYFVSVAVLGAIGGFTNCCISGELVWFHYDRRSKVLRLGILGNMFVGAVAAIVAWGVYGPFSSVDITSTSLKFSATPGQIIPSILVGLGGSNYLTVHSQNAAQNAAARNLGSSLSNMTPGDEDV